MRDYRVWLAAEATKAEAVGGTALAVRPDGSPNDPRPHGVRLSVWSCGPVMGLMADVPPCEALVSGMVDEAEAIIKGRLAAMCR